MNILVLSSYSKISQLVDSCIVNVSRFESLTKVCKFTIDIMELMQKLAPKVGIDNPQVLSEAIELIRHINDKRLGTLTEIHKYVMCMDIAASKLGSKFDYDAAYKTLGTKKVIYNRQCTMVKNILQIKEQKSIHEICIQLSCEQVNKTAEQLLNKYKECDVLDRDFNHPQYSVAAVWIICRLNKLSIKKSDFLSLSTLTSQQWNKMEIEFTKFADENGFKGDSMKKSTKKKGNDLMNVIELKSREMQAEYMPKKHNEEITESYEVWRKRILDEAYAHVKSNSV